MMARNHLLRYADGLLRRWWLFPIGVILAIGGAALAAQQATPRYVSVSRVLVNSGAGGDERYWNILADQQLAKTYAEIATDRATLTEVTSRLQIATTPEVLARDIRVRLIPDTRIIEIAVDRPDPDEATAIANSIAQVIATPGTRPGIETLGTQASLQAEITALQAKIRAIERDLVSLDDQIRAAVAARADSTALVQRHDTLRTLMTTWQNSLTALYQTLLRTSSDQPVRVVSLATPASVPRTPDFTTRLLIGGLVGFCLAAVVGLVAEAVDRRVRSPLEIQGQSLPPVLADIPPIRGSGPIALVTGPANKAAGEALRVLRSALLTDRVAGRATTLLVSSAASHHEAVAVATNLAAILAKGGAHVGLVDGNMRQPALQTLFHLEGRPGLAQLLKLSQVSPDRLLYPTELPGLQVMVAGETSENPADLLAGRGIQAVLQPIESLLDLIVVVGPPARQYADSAILANAADSTLLVVRPGILTLDEIRASVDALEISGGRVTGLVFSRATGRSHGKQPSRAGVPAGSSTREPLTERGTDPSGAIVRSQ